MANKGPSAKHLMIDKTNTTIVVVVGLAAFLSTFSLVSSKALFSQRSYQNRVVAKQEQAKKQLQDNIAAVDTLKASYTEFASRSENIIGGSSSEARSPRGGDNGKIVLDALPSTYDYPALISSIEKILKDRNYLITQIGGTDNTATDGVSSSLPGSTPPASSSGSATAKVALPAGVVEMPFEISAKSNYQASIGLLSAFSKSIRPLYVQQLSISAEDNAIVTSLSGKSFFQPEKVLDIRKEVVK